MNRTKSDRKQHMGRQTLTVGGWKVSAWIDRDGFLRTDVVGPLGAEVLPLPHPWAQTAGKFGRQVYTANENVIEFETANKHEDMRYSPSLLRRVSADKQFNAYWHLEGEKRSPSVVADSIEQARRKEGRDIETGKQLRRVC